jgi:exopolyphosphatase/pppGpp-phosphohydrolase
MSVHVRRQLARATDVIRDIAPAMVVFASGTAGAVRRLAVGTPDRAAASGYLGHDLLRRSVEGLLGLAPHEITGLGVSRRRADTVGTAAVVVDALMDLLDVPEVWMSQSGLRDGVVLREWQRSMANRGHDAEAWSAEWPHTPVLEELEELDDDEELDDGLASCDDPPEDGKLFHVVRDCEVTVAAAGLEK